MKLRLKPAATNTTPGLTPDTVHTSAGPKATPPPPVAGVAAKDQLSYNIEDIIKMIQNSALPDSVLIMMGDSPVVDYTQIDHRIGCTLEEPGAIMVADMFAAKSHKGKTIKDNNPPNKMVFTCTWGGVRLRCLVDCGSTLEAIYNTGNNAVPVNKSASAIKSRHRLKTGGGYGNF